MPRNLLIKLCLCLLVLGLQPRMSQAQPPGFGGRGGGGFGGGRGMGGLADLLRDEEITTTLGVTAEQLEQVDAIREESRASMESQNFGELFRQAETDEERTALGEQMRLAGEASTAKLEEQLQTVLDEAQYTRLRQVFLQRAGINALVRPEVMTALELTEDQQTELQAILQERQGARMQLGFRASEEETAAFNQEWDSQVLFVLTDEQRDQWAAEQGEAFVAIVPEAIPATAGTTAVPSTTTPSTGRGPIGIPGATNSFGETSGNEPMLTFSFNDAPWELVLRRLAEISGYTLDLAVEPPGSFTYYDPNSYTPTEARDVINGYLAQRGYLLIRRHNSLVTVNVDDIPPNLIPRVPLAELPNYGRHDIVSVVIPAPGVDVDDLAEQLEGLRGPQGKVVGLDATNTIVVTDLAFIVGQMAEVVEQVSGGPEDIVFKAIRLEFISAAVAEPTVKSLLGISDAAINVSASASPWGGGGGGDGGGRGRGGWGGGDGGGGGQQQQPTAARPQVTIDSRTNSLLVAGTPSQVRIVESALLIIDVEADENPWGGGPQDPYLVVYTVTDADASEVAKTINAMIPGVVVNEDGRNGRIHIMATPDQHQEIATLIRQLDGLGGASTVAVIPLSRMDPMVAVNTLSSMFISDGSNSPTIEADIYGRQVMIRGTQDQIAQARTILLSMGEDGSGQRTTGGTMQAYSLGGRDAQEVTDLIETLWGRGPRASTPVTIINPDQRQGEDRVEFFNRPEAGSPGPDESRPPLEEAGIPSEYLLEDLAPGETAPEPRVPSAAAPIETGGSRAQTHPLRDDAPASTLVLTSLDDGSNDEPARSTVDSVDEEADGQVDLSEVRITVLGGEIIVEHPDPEVVDEMMTLLEQVIQTLPPRSSWKIFPLQVADATTVATLLQTVIPEATVLKSTTASSSGILGGLTSGFSSLGTGVMNMTGLDSMGVGSMSLQIIPETTHNALIVSGPQYLIDEVVVWLNILDSPDWPDNYRNREPKMIPVLYADSQDVYDILQQTYGDLLENDQNRQGRQAQQALAAMFGGGGGRGQEQQQQPQAAMTLSHDPRTNHIIVSANETLFLEVQGIVEDIDNAARDARRTVQVLQLQYGNPQVVGQTVGSLMPRVSVSGGGGSRTSSSSTSSSGTGSSSSGTGGPSPDDLRRMMEFRSQMQGGGGGQPTAPTGGGTGGRFGFGGGGGGFPGGGGGGRGGGGFPGGGGGGGRRGGGN